MAGETRVLLGGKFPLAGPFTFEWYRGTDAKPFTFDIPTARADDLIQFVNGLTAGETFLELHAPDKGGNRPGTKVYKIQGVFVERIVKTNPLKTRVTLYDRRLQLARRIMDKDFNLQFGDGYLNETREATYAEAIRTVCG